MQTSLPFFRVATTLAIFLLCTSQAQATFKINELADTTPVKRASDANIELLNDLQSCLKKADPALPVEKRADNDPEYSLDRHGNLVRNEIPAQGQAGRLGVFENVSDELLQQVSSEIILVEYRFSTRGSQKPQRIGCAYLRPADHFTRVNLLANGPLNPVVKKNGKKVKGQTNTNDVIRFAIFLTRHDARALQLVPSDDDVIANEEKQEYQQWIDGVFKPIADLIQIDTDPKLVEQLGLALTALGTMQSLRHDATDAVNDSMLQWMKANAWSATDCSTKKIVDQSEQSKTALQKALVQARTLAIAAAQHAAKNAEPVQCGGAASDYEAKKCATAKALSDTQALTTAISTITSHADSVHRQTTIDCGDAENQTPPDIARIDFPMEPRAADKMRREPDLEELRTLAEDLGKGQDRVAEFMIAWSAFKERHDGKFEQQLQISDDQKVSVGAVPHAAARTSWITLNWFGKSLSDERMLFGAFDLPAASAADHTILLQMGTVAAVQTPLTIIHGNALATAWATHVSTRQSADLSFFWVEGQNTHPDPTSALNVLFSGLGGKYTISASTLGISNNVSMLQTDSRHLPEPLAEFTSVARTTRMLPGSTQYGMIADRIYTVTVCLGSCVDPTAKSDGSVKSASVATSYDPNGPGQAQAQAHIVSPAGRGFTVLGALTYDLDCSNPDHSTQFYDNEWRPLALGASAETFQLRRVAQPAQAFTFSFIAALLAGENWTGRWGGGLGLTWLTGGGTSASFKQYTADAVWSPPLQSIVNRMFIVIGAGVRLVDHVAEPSQIGDVVTVQRTGGAAPSTPVASTKTGADVVVHLGVAVNLQLITDAIANLGKGSSK